MPKLLSVSAELTLQKCVSLFPRCGRFHAALYYPAALIAVGEKLSQAVALLLRGQN